MKHTPTFSRAVVWINKSHFHKRRKAKNYNEDSGREPGREILLNLEMKGEEGETERGQGKMRGCQRIYRRSANATPEDLCIQFL